LPRRRISDYLGEEPPTRPHRKGGDDVDLVIKKTVEATVAELVKGLLGEIRSLREAVESLSSRVEKLESAMRQCQAGPQARAARGSRGGKRRSRLADELASILESDGFILASKARARLGVSPQRLRDAAAEVGAEVVELAGDFAVVDREAMGEYLALLRTVKTSDPAEAAKAMGKYKELFEKMREATTVYYDARRGYWRMIE